MAYIRQIDYPEATGDLEEFYDRLVEVAGSVPNIVKLASLKLPAMRAAQDLYQSVLYHESGLTMTQKEAVSTLVSAMNGCGYCVDHHGAALERRADEEGIGGAGLADQIIADYRDAGLDPRTEQILAFAEKLTDEPEAMGPEDVAELREHGMTDEEILDLVQLVAYFNYTNRVATALGVDPEEG